MRILSAGVNLVIVNIFLFLGFTLLHPALASAVDEKITPLGVAPHYFWPGAFLIFIGGYLIYRHKGNFSEALQTFGLSIFMPGGLSLIFHFFTINDFLSGASFTGASIIENIGEWYSGHNASISIGVSAVYLFLGGFVYYLGHKLEKTKEKMRIWR